MLSRSRMNSQEDIGIVFCSAPTVGAAAAAYPPVGIGDWFSRRRCALDRIWSDSGLDWRVVSRRGLLGVEGFAVLFRFDPNRSTQRVVLRAVNGHARYFRLEVSDPPSPGLRRSHVSDGGGALHRSQSTGGQAASLSNRALRLTGRWFVEPCTQQRISCARTDCSTHPMCDRAQAIEAPRSTVILGESHNGDKDSGQHLEPWRQLPAGAHYGQRGRGGPGDLFFAAAASELRHRVTDATTALRNAASEGFQSAAARTADVVERVSDIADDMIRRGQGARDDVADAVARGAHEMARGAREIEDFAKASKSEHSAARS
jgi:hypothetical protein